MDKITRVLVPFDFSKCAKKALDYAVNFVGNRDIKIHLLYISDKADIERMRNTYDDLCDIYEEKLKLPLRWVWSDNTLIDTIIEVQKVKEVDIIIMGTSGIKKEAKKTNTSKLIEKIDCPVIVVPEKTPKRDIKNISLVIDDREIDNPKSLEMLLDIARNFNAKVHVLTIENKPKVYGYSQIDEKNENTILYYLENFYEDHTFIENTDILEGIFSYVNGHDMDVITILSRNHAKRSMPSEGLLTRELVMQAEVPVLVIE